jgi:hypothetical protein
VDRPWTALVALAEQQSRDPQLKTLEHFVRVPAGVATRASSVGWYFDWHGGNLDLRSK